MENKYKEMISEDALLEMANRYIQLQHEYEEYVTAAHEIITNLKNEINQLKTK